MIDGLHPGWAFFQWPPTREEWIRIREREAAYQAQRELERAEECRELGSIGGFLMRLFQIERRP